MDMRMKPDAASNPKNHTGLLATSWRIEIKPDISSGDEHIQQPRSLEKSIVSKKHHKNEPKILQQENLAAGDRRLVDKLKAGSRRLGAVGGAKPWPIKRYLAQALAVPNTPDGQLHCKGEGGGRREDGTGTKYQVISSGRNSLKRCPYCSERYHVVLAGISSCSSLSESKTMLLRLVRRCRPSPCETPS